MSWIDLLRMSTNNLRRRKLRTFLTVLGVIIGTASIVVMISLGLGLQESLLAEVEQSGGVTNLKVSGAYEADANIYMYRGMEEDSVDEDHSVTDETIGDFENIKHVQSGYPVLT